MTKIEGSGSINHRHGSADADPHENVMDPEHWFQKIAILRIEISLDNLKLLCH
jgi:hypothetical protein